MPAWNVGRQAHRLRARSLALCVKRPEYLHVPELGRRAAAVFDGAVAVVILREPVSRFRSAFHHYRHFGLLADPSPSAYLERWMRREHQPRSIWSQPGEFSFYGNSLERLIEAFEGRVQIFFQDDVLTDPAGCLGAVWRAAELDLVAPGSQRELPRLNTGSASQTPSRVGMLGGRLAAKQSRFGTVLPRRRPLQNLGSAILASPPSQGAPKWVTPPRPSVIADFAKLLIPDLARVEALMKKSVPTSWHAPEM